MDINNVMEQMKTMVNGAWYGYYHNTQISYTNLAPEYQIMSKKINHGIQSVSTCTRTQESMKKVYDGIVQLSAIIKLYVPRIVIGYTDEEMDTLFAVCTKVADMYKNTPEYEFMVDLCVGYMLATGDLLRSFGTMG